MLGIFGFAATIVLARILTPSELGIAALAAAIVAVGTLATNGGLVAGLIQQPEAPSHAQLQSALGLQLLIAVGAVAVVTALGLALHETWLLAAVMTLSLPISVFRTPAIIHAQRALNFGPLAQNQVVEAFAFQFFTVVLVLLGLGVWGIAIAAVLKAVIATVMLNARLAPGYVRPRLRWRLIRPMLRLGAPFQAIQVYNTSHESGVTFVIGAVGGTAVLGQWNLVVRLMQIIAVIISSLYSVAFSTTARLLEAGASAQQLLSRSLGMMTIAIGIATVGAGSAAAALVPMVFGARWADSGDAFTVVCVTIAMNAPVSTCVIGYLIAIDRTYDVLFAVVPSGVISVALTVILVPSQGVMGVVWPMLLWTVVELILLVRAARRHVEFPAFRITLPPFFVAAACIGSGWAITSPSGTSPLVAVAVVVAAEAMFLAYTVLARRRDIVQLMQLLLKSARVPWNPRFLRSVPTAAP